MKAILRSMSKNKIKNIIYTVLLFTVFSIITLLANAILLGISVTERIGVVLRSIPYDINMGHEELMERRNISVLHNAVQIPVSSLFIAVLLTVLVCMIILPFIYRLFSLSRGYEIGILRALGLGKAKAWLLLSVENILQTAVALFMAMGLSLNIHTPFAFMLLSINDGMEAELLGIQGVPEILYGFDGYSAFLVIILSAAMVCVVSAMNLGLINRNAPLKLIREYK
jgi:hypothetical protein